MCGINGQMSKPQIDMKEKLWHKTPQKKKKKASLPTGAHVMIKNRRIHIDSSTFS